MFASIRHRLLISYLGVLSAVLTVFAIAVRFTFAHNLNQQLIARLETLATAAALELELDGGELNVDLETITNANQAVQWFDREGHLLEQQGDYISQLPFNPKKSLQTQSKPYPAKSLTIPVNDYSKGIFIGYTRVSESTVALNNTLKNLDLGLAAGVVVALTLSGVGGIWLTRQAMQPIEKSFQQLQQFTSNASHELRSPLMAIKTNAAVALKYPEGIRSSDVEKFEAIKSASTQLAVLTEKLLLLARTDGEVLRVRAQVEAQKQNIVNLTNILEQLLNLYQFQAQAQQIYLKSQLEKDLFIKGDEVQLTQLFTNLINNALRFTNQGDIVEIVARHEVNQIVITVEDTGIGIALEHLDRIFERFWQVEQARSHEVEGFGLGLAIAQNIAINHGGIITVTSKLGQGSCFKIKL